MLADKGFEADGLAALRLRSGLMPVKACAWPCAGAAMDSRILVKQRTTAESSKRI